jgi:hypothetical protein
MQITRNSIETVGSSSSGGGRARYRHAGARADRQTRETHVVRVSELYRVLAAAGVVAAAGWRAAPAFRLLDTGSSAAPPRRGQVREVGERKVSGA